MQLSFGRFNYSTSGELSHVISVDHRIVLGVNPSDYRRIYLIVGRWNFMHFAAALLQCPMHSQSRISLPSSFSALRNNTLLDNLVALCSRASSTGYAAAGVDLWYNIYTYI